jgi:predicted deacylase
METYFSPDYATARSRFIEAVERAHGKLYSLPIQATRPKGERLTIDIAWFGSDNPRRVFVHSSGLHGVEGFAGSAIQLQWLAEGIQALPEDGAILIIHVLNPYGMASLRRFNENNVDLNRNFQGPYEGAPPGYEKLGL